MTSELSNCQECGRLFIVKHSDKLCLECCTEQQIKVSAIRQYLRDHPGQTAVEMAEAMDMSLHFILGLIRQGILVAS